MNIKKIKLTPEQAHWLKEKDDRKDKLVKALNDTPVEIPVAELGRITDLFLSFDEANKRFTQEMRRTK